jgi:hypothetical protein
MLELDLDFKADINQGFRTEVGENTLRRRPLLQVAVYLTPPHCSLCCTCSPSTAQRCAARPTSRADQKSVSASKASETYISGAPIPRKHAEEN